MGRTDQGARVLEVAMSTQGGRLLVVDDDALNRTLLAVKLEDDGFAVETAANGRQALALLAEKPFDVVLLDLVMPELDGFEVLEQIKRDGRLQHIPVIVISALDEVESVIRCVENGATDYLSKPFDPVLLRARINACLANKRLRDLEQAHLQAIQVERERADRLLLNILPASVAEQLKQGWRQIAEGFAEVSVLFADIADFTPFAAQHSPAEVLDLLNAIFSTFDRLVDKNGLEKIKTIGDAYMVAGGLPVPRPDHAEAVADLALEMLAEMRRLSAERGERLGLRIGIHSGPVIAGVIGSSKFAYDLWGDTVNIASRMESYGTPDRIQISAATYELLKDKYLFSKPGVLKIKGRGEMTTYMLLGKKTV